MVTKNIENCYCSVTDLFVTIIHVNTVIVIQNTRFNKLINHLNKYKRVCVSGLHFYKQISAVSYWKKKWNKIIEYGFHNSFNSNFHKALC